MKNTPYKYFFPLLVFVPLAFASIQTLAQEKQVVDEIVAIVGQNMILESQLEQIYLQEKLQGTMEGDALENKCLILETLLIEKLMVNKAELDSIEISPSQVENELNARLRYFISQFGTQERLEEFYDKSLIEIKEEFRGLIETQLLVQDVRNLLTENVYVTPKEVKAFYKDLPEDSIELINSEVEIAHIVRMPPVTMEQKRQVKERLRELRKRIIDGENFATLAILYSEDPGSASKGGELGFYGRGELFPEFEVVAFKLQEGETSDIVETEAGFHIIQMIERKGEYINVRHILLQTKVSPLDLGAAKRELDSVAILIRDGTITFEDAVKEYSDDDSKNSGGMIVNPQTGTAKFEMDQLDPQVSFAIDKLEVGEISNGVPMKTEDAKDAYRIILLKSRTDPHRANLTDDYYRIYTWALNNKKDKKLVEWVNNNSKTTFLRINERYKDCKFHYSFSLDSID